ncbi:MAG: TOMM precursor leader peptide-binding protein [Nostoc sp. DedVER02]|uniref:TOMM precursor leader peptide-binding protein n=1 Tax=unclassified Nostoc TaxID=2593658 RepID=UPI002AD4F03A|nr:MULTISPECIES: TOMM precursor leader peptide-binding protein [unclassified Nostoc]MDZ7988775.1 TOMM precursor leader peptide-binding protein [Nostoc sp. DedVER02]MDZ8115101.1 TOMM precursor leader peptide-binding protein [Nostoc sp. DedVER01b]
MLNKPRFKPEFRVEIVQPKKVYLLSECKSFALTGNLYVLLAPLLDGNHTVEQITNRLKWTTNRAQIDRILTKLADKGYITEASDRLPDAVQAFWSYLGVDSETAFSRLQATRVAVRTFGNIQSAPFIEALKTLHINISNEADFTVVLTEDYLQPELAEFNRQTQKPWLLIKPIGMFSWIGPIFIPGQTGCWQCLAHRLQKNFPVETSIKQQKSINTSLITAIASLPSSWQISLNLAAQEVAKWVVLQKSPQLEGKIITFDTETLSTENHSLTKRPQCPVCGNLEFWQKQKLQPIELQSRPKNFTDDGGHRTLRPEQTVEKYSNQVSWVTGVVKELVKSNKVEDLIHVYFAAYQSADNLDNYDRLRKSLEHYSAGKGKTDSQSKASALGEALERYSGIFTDEEYRIKATFAQLGDAAIHPQNCLLYSDKQYQNRHEWNPQHGTFAWVADPYDLNQEIEWTPVWSLTNQTQKYLPTAFCYFDYSLPEGHKFCVGDSNGNAAGNTLEEAILQGFMELVERDSVALWWYNRVKRPQVDLASFNEPYLLNLQDYYQTKFNRQLWVLDITSDLNIPTFAAISRHTQGEKENILIGFGTHFDPTIAILRAVTEVNQSLTLDLDNEFEFAPESTDIAYWYANATVENQPYLVPCDRTPVKVYSDYPYLGSKGDLREDIEICADMVKKLGLELAFLDLTRPDIGLNVVKVIVPGLRHFWPRFAPGRLYDIPVKLGWLSAPLKEEELNPIPMFI